jgi:hypothetical protein
LVYRIDAEAVSLKKKLDEIAASDEGREKTSEQTTLATIEVSLFVVNRKIQSNRKLAQLWCFYCFFKSS